MSAYPLMSARWHGNYLRRCAHCTAIFFTDSMLDQVVSICVVWRYYSDPGSEWRHEHLCGVHARQVFAGGTEVVYLFGNDLPALVGSGVVPVEVAGMVA